MLQFLFVLLIFIIGTEAITELLVKSEIFSHLRKPLFNRKATSKVCKFFSDLIECGYCTSVWVAFFILLAATYLPKLTFGLCFVLAIHRLSNVWHFIIDRLRGVEI